MIFGAKKILFTGFEPNITRRDLASALPLLVRPWRWQKGSGRSRVESWLKNFFDLPEAIVFDSGRNALLFALKSLELKPGDEVLVQAYTCVVVVNAIQFAGATPVFVDMKEDYFMDPEGAEHRVTPRTKAIIIQHTFGIPADITGLMAVAKRHALPVIEDCAHTIGGIYQRQLLGTFGDMAILSFGSDKVASAARGGAVITKQPDYGARLRQQAEALRETPYGTIFRHLLHYPAFLAGTALYHIGIGKAILWFTKTFRLTTRIMTQAEKEGRPDKTYPARFPNALAELLLLQLERLEANNLHRKELSRIYQSSIRNSAITLHTEKRGDTDYAYVRYPILTNRPKDLLLFAKRRGIFLGDWYDTVVAPCDGSCDHTGYKAGSCPQAESTSRGSVNLPTSEKISIIDAKQIAECINAYREYYDRG